MTGAEAAANAWNWVGFACAICVIAIVVAVTIVAIRGMIRQSRQRP